MTNFSPFFAGSEGLVTPVGLAPPFSVAGVAAHNTPELRKIETERMRQTRVDLFNFDFIIPPKSENLFTSTLHIRSRVIPTKFKENLNF